MRTIWIVGINQLKRTLRMRTVWINMFLLPLLIIFLLGTALSGAKDIGAGSGEKIEPVKLAVVGGSAASPLLNAYLQEPGIAAYAETVPVNSRGLAQQMLRSGSVDYAVAVPEDFDKNITSGGSASLELMRGKSEGNNRVAEHILRPFVDALNDRAGAVKQLGPSALAAYSSLPAPASVVKEGALGAGGETYTSFQYYAASMLVMFMMYSGLSLSGSMYGERDNRTLQRMYAMPIRPLHLFAGKVAAAGTVAALQGLTIILVSKWLYGVDWGNRPWALAGVCVLMIAFTMGLAMTAVFLTTSQSQSASLIQTVIVVMTFLSGGFFPFEGFLQRIGSFTVNHWASEGLLRMMLHEPSSQVYSALGVLTAISAVLLLIGLLMYRRKGYAYE